MKGVIFGLLVIAVLFAGCAKPAETPAPTTTAAPPTPAYKGTIYVAGEGGHIAVANVEIYPDDANPIKVVGALNRIIIGHAIHDVRVDANDKTKLYWSAILKDSDGPHYGTADLKTNAKVEDRNAALDETFKFGPMYCGSGQSANEFLPVFMGYEGFISVIDKTALAEKRVFLRGNDTDVNYAYAHGTNTPDMGKFLLISNGASVPGNASTLTGVVNLYMLDMASLVNGEIKVVNKNSLTGYPASVIAFRQGFTPDGKYLLQSGRDRFFLVDANTLQLVDEEPMAEASIENHDAMSTPDGKYAVLTLRAPVLEDEATVKDGQLQLYDITNKKLVGKPVSVCKACHGASINFGSNANLCGEDAVWK